MARHLHEWPPAIVYLNQEKLKPFEEAAQDLGLLVDVRPLNSGKYSHICTVWGQPGAAQLLVDITREPKS
jgi:hypothetical protein